MSLARARGALRTRLTSGTITAGHQRRCASDHAHDEHDHHHEVDTTVYPAEGFGSRMWLYLAAFSAAGFTWYKFGAEPTTASSSITRWLTKLQVPEEIWVKRNEQHLLMSTQNAEDIQLTRDAKLPSVHRYWGPMSIGQCSPHGRPVGMSVDHSDVRVKAERE